MFVACPKWDRIDPSANMRNRHAKANPARTLVPVALLGLIALGVILIVREEFGSAETDAPRVATRHAAGPGNRIPGPGPSPVVPARSPAPAPIASVERETPPPVSPQVAAVERDSPAVRGAMAIAVPWGRTVLAGLSNPRLTLSSGIITPADRALIGRTLEHGSKRIVRYGFVDPKGKLVLATRADRLGKVVATEAALRALRAGHPFAEPQEDGSRSAPTVVVLVPSFDHDRFLGAAMLYVAGGPDTGG
jgi:hypothetical protein